MVFPRYVYKIEHKPTGKIYIGSSMNPELRFRSHMYSLRGGKHVVRNMQDDFDAFGEEYTYEVLDTIKDYSEKDKEYQYMVLYKSYDPEFGYNCNEKYSFSKSHSCKCSEQSSELQRIITTNGYKLSFIAKQLGISKQTFSNKLIKLSFKNDEIEILSKILRLKKKDVSRIFG